MSDYQRGSVLGGSIERSLDNSFAMNVQCRRSFVEDEKFRLTNNGAGNGKSLSLATAQLESPLPNACQIALRSISFSVTHKRCVSHLWQLLNEFISIGLSAS